MNVLVISAHPDDETLGAGGTLLGHISRGDSVHWAVATKPFAPVHSEDFIRRAAEQVQAVSKAFGFRNNVRLGFDTTRLDTTPQSDLIDALLPVVESVRPEVVYLVHGGDIHSDHRALFSAAMSIFKPFHCSRLGVKRILSFETLSSTDAALGTNLQPFVPNVFVDITPHMPRKLEIMSMFETEAQGELLPRGSSAIEALGRYRGSTVGVKYAEAFVLIRELA
jgi:LmbE family N-acetylglucosaminyl deacetylase